MGKRVLLVYKGDFAENQKGPEIRYLSIAKNGTSDNCKVFVAGKSATAQSEKNYVSLKTPWKFLTIAFRSDCLVFHGGGAFLMGLGLILSLVGRRIFLDAYAPHWLELYDSSRGEKKGFKKGVKIFVNLLRVIFALLTFDGVLVANKRQLDLVRGIAAATGRLDAMSRVITVSFGCDQGPTGRHREQLEAFSGGRIRRDGFLVGWLGGVWDWFHVTPLVRSLAQVTAEDPQIQGLFFGVPVDRQKELESLFRQFAGRVGSLVFLPWAPYERRLELWSGLDLALVWSAQGLENDYAARTRNFDCLALGLPVVQNRDDYWGPLLEEKECGIQTDEVNLAATILRCKNNPEILMRLRSNMLNLREEFQWGRVARNFLEAVMEKKGQSFFDKLFGLVIFLILWPAVLLGCLVSLRSSRNARND